MSDTMQSLDQLSSLKPAALSACRIEPAKPNDAKVVSVINIRLRRRKLSFGAGLLAAGALLAKLGEKPPALPVALEMVQRKVRGDRFKPSARGRAAPKHVKMLERLDEHVLRYVLGLRVVGDEPDGGREDHILVGTHEGGEFSRGTYFRGRFLHWRGIVQVKNTARAEKSRKSAMPGPGMREEGVRGMAWITRRTP